MANEIVTTDGYLSIDGTDFSAACQEIRFNPEVDAVEASRMGSGWKQRIGGAKDWSITIQLVHTLADSGLTEKLWDWMGMVKAVIFKPNGDTASATNPRFAGNMLVPGVPLGGAWGTLHGASFTLLGAGECTRAESDA